MLNRRSRFVPLAIAAVGALALPGAAHAAKNVQNVVCKGSEARCTAAINLAGGASNKTINVELPGTSELRLIYAHANPSWVEGAYAIEGARYSLGGSLYTLKLNAVESIPKGAKLFLEFGTPERILNCGGIRTGVGGLIIETTGLGSTSAFGCPQAAGVARTWLKRFKAGQPVKKFSVRGVSYGCKIVPFKVNINCRSTSTLVAFEAPHNLKDN
ncbi:hypothetical protein Q5424_07465 [Conexibacter sp. JD483]|uniref:hypothetical protein n=1 Tax=unclassified Conexibacter TaxID=2627773 RepID=UPI002719D33F|nr:MULTISPECIES: hypothetical protein [unclassified Conexibacter]MDO8187116.1 hypothetical protein [Conexibacter sp. CPCC 205706]MDO8200292.1 hypothetical protein [Conexibacter sp. CPCC 205762]MDR9368912.1 hypothetical protein [Conexibacter sp. JD483]